MRNANAVPPLKIAALVSGRTYTADPAAIAFRSQYNVVWNLNSRLFEWDADSRLIPMFVEKFSWRNENTLEISLPKLFRTIDGYEITPEDVELSFKRLMILKENSHGSLHDFLCADDELEKITDNCPGMRVENEKLVFTIKDARLAKFFVTMLTGADFSILSKHCVDWSNPLMPIVDFRNTTGVYYADTTGPDVATLKANLLHPFFVPGQMASEIILTPIDFNKDAYGQLADGWRTGKFDHISSTVNLTHSQWLELASVSEATLFQTRQIALIHLQWTQRGVLEFSAAERSEFGKLYKQLFFKSKYAIGSEDTEQYFPPSSDGYLDAGKFRKSRWMRPKLLPLNRSRMADVILASWLPEAELEILGDNPIAKNVVALPPSMNFLTEPSQEGLQPHVFSSQIDSSFTESLSQLSYMVRYNLFGFDQPSGRRFIEKYINVEDKGERLDMIREQHDRVLNDEIVTPVAFETYKTLTRDGWKVEASPFFASVPFWQIHYDR